MRIPRVLSLLGGAAALIAATGVAAVAQEWPERPVTLVVPYGPGASNDTFTRAIAEIMSNTYDQPFVVENRPGAGGFTGSNRPSPTATRSWRCRTASSASSR